MKVGQRWGYINAEQFFAVVENEGLQDMMLDVLEPQRGQSNKVLLSYPSIIANKYSKENYYSPAIYYGLKCDPGAAEAISHSIFTKGSGKVGARSDVEGQGN